MSITRLTRERLYADEKTFNSLLPYVKWDPQKQVFVHSDASLWSIWEAEPLLLTSTSDTHAFQSCAALQELLDALDPRMSVQFNWITSFDVEDLLNRSLSDYPLNGAAGWMARRWLRMMRDSARTNKFGARVKKLKLLVCFRYDPEWKPESIFDQIKDSLGLVFKGVGGENSESNRTEQLVEFVDFFRGEVEGTVSRMSEMGLKGKRVDGQGLIDLLYPILNRRSTKGGKVRRGRSNAVPVPEFDPDDILANQVSSTAAQHPEDGFLVKDGRVFHAVSMVKPPKQALPMMTVPLQSSPYESIISVTYSKDRVDKQLARLSRLDATLGLREFGPGGRSNQEISHQISTIRQARDTP